MHYFHAIFKSFSGGNKILPDPLWEGQPKSSRTAFDVMRNVTLHNNNNKQLCSECRIVTLQEINKASGLYTAFQKNMRLHLGQ